MSHQVQNLRAFFHRESNIQVSIIGLMTIHWTVLGHDGPFVAAAPVFEKLGDAAST
jgi:hypothetical protein